MTPFCAAPWHPLLADMRSVGRRFLLGSLALLALGGFGCKKTPTYDYSTALNNLRAPTRGAITQPSAPVTPETANAFDEVRRVVENLSQADSFRAHLILPTTDGSATGELEFEKEEGFHGTLQFPGALRTELYAIGSDLWFRASGADWTNLKNTPEGTNTAQMFRSAFTFGDVTSTLFLKEMKLVDTVDDRDGCKRYVFERPSAEGGETTNVCVKNNLPVYIASTSPTAHFEIRYRDFGQKIELKAPIIK